MSVLLTVLSYFIGAKTFNYLDRNSAYTGFVSSDPGCAEQLKAAAAWAKSRESGVLEFRIETSLAGTDADLQSSASQVEVFIAWRPINHRPQTGKPPSHSATPELLTSRLDTEINNRAEYSVLPALLRVAGPPVIRMRRTD